MEHQKTNKFIKFLFPFWPVKIFKSITGICVLAALLGLSILLNLFKINITAGITISFAWLPGIIIGWYFGPIVGLLMGALIDTINWLIYGGVWFWMYALQEPILGLIVGIISSLFNIIRNTKQHFSICLIINQIMLIGFIISSIFIVFYYTDHNNPFFQSISNVENSTSNMIKTTQLYLRWIILGILLGLFVIVEMIVGYRYYLFKKDRGADSIRFETFLFITIVALTSTVIFSFLLGPISAIEYYKFLNNTSYVPNLVNYGVMYYLLPRVIKECFKTPIYIIILTTLVCALNPAIVSFKNRIINSYHSEK